MTQKSYVVLFMRDPARTGRPQTKIGISTKNDAAAQHPDTAVSTKIVLEKKIRHNFKNVKLTKNSLAFFFFLVK